MTSQVEVESRPPNVPKELVVSFDRMDHTLAPHVHEIIDGFRATTPICWTPAHGGHWILTRYDDIHDVLRQPEIFSSSQVGIPANQGQTDKLIPLELDGEEHGDYRRLLTPLFSPPNMARLEPQIRTLVNDIITGVVDDGRCEFVNDVARPLPVTVFLMLMGWPLEDSAQLSDWCDTLMHGVPGLPPEESDAARMEAAGLVHQYFVELTNERRKNPQNDFTTSVINAKLADGSPVPEGRLLDMMMLLFHAGLDTVKGTLSMGMLHLAGNPALRDRLVTDPSLVATTVEEILRWDPPAWPARKVTHPTEFRGVQFAAGDMVMLAFSAANRDEQQFPESQEFLPDREPNRHLGFSAGPHRCIGSHLARVEMRLALEEIHIRLPHYRLDPERPAVRHLGGVFGLESLHLLF